MALPVYLKDKMAVIDDHVHPLLPVQQLPAQYLTNMDDDVIKVLCNLVIIYIQACVLIYCVCICMPRTVVDKYGL